MSGYERRLIVAGGYAVANCQRQFAYQKLPPFKALFAGMGPKSEKSLVCPEAFSI